MNGKGPVKRSDEGVRRATGWDRDEWFTVLDRWGAPDRPYREIADWLTGEDGGTTRVNVSITSAEGKSQAAIEHERLPDADTAQTTKAFWRDRLTALKAMLEDKVRVRGFSAPAPRKSSRARKGSRGRRTATARARAH